MIVEIDIFAWIVRFIILSVVLYVYRFIRSKIGVTAKGKAVLITGCDSGFGLMTSERLAKKGFLVYSACLTDNGVDYFHQQGNPNIFPIKMDVTKEDTVKEAYEEIERNLTTRGYNGLWGIINNAGLLRSGELEVMSIFNWQIQMNVNVLGMVIVSKNFFPLLLKGKGRIVNIASVAGRFATPATSGYNASKYAVEGLTDSWRRELSVWGIKVILVEPGIMKTPLWDVPFTEASIDLIWNNLNEEQKARYGRDYFIESEKVGRDLVAKFGGDPKQVVDVLEQSVVAKWPHSRYGVGLDSFIWIGLSYFPSCISDALLPFILKPIPPAALLKNKN